MKTQYNLSMVQAYTPTRSIIRLTHHEQLLAFQRFVTDYWPAWSYMITSRPEAILVRLLRNEFHMGFFDAFFNAIRLIKYFDIHFELDPSSKIWKMTSSLDYIKESTDEFIDTRESSVGRSAA